ncbi:polysaccharide deacetylase [Halobacteriales archaeon SW_7_68_16]|nr:MAG: polysaccharide deacetylase [Halobacteriales archaeon SW_7_68_16]
MASRLALVFDDGPTSDRSLVAPVLDAYDAPATFAVVPTWLGAENHLTTDGVRALADAGHEIATHGHRHRRLQAMPLAADVAPGDEWLAVDGRVAPDDSVRLLVGDTHEITDGDRRREVTVAALEEGRVGLDAPVDAAFDASATVLRPTESTIRDELAGGRDAVDDLGVDPRTVVFPYDRADGRAMRIARRTHDVVANAAVRSLPNLPGRDPTDLRRFYLETDHLRPAEIETYLDRIVETDGIGILAGHSAWETVTADRIEMVLAGARGRDIDLVRCDELAGIRCQTGDGPAGR